MPPHLMRFPEMWKHHRRERGEDGRSEKRKSEMRGTFAAGALSGDGTGRDCAGLNSLRSEGSGEGAVTGAADSQRAASRQQCGRGQYFFIAARISNPVCEKPAGGGSILRAGTPVDHCPVVGAGKQSGAAERRMCFCRMVPVRTDYHGGAGAVCAIPL